MINNTPLYIDLLDYLERDGIASLSNNFDPNAFMTNYDELDTTSPLINNSTVAPTIPYIIPPLGGGDGGDGPRQGLESLNIDPIDKIIDYTNFNHPTMNEIANDDDEYLFDAENFDEFYNPLSMGIKGSTIHEIGLAAAEKERARLQEVARVKAFEEQQRQAKKELEAKAAQIEANRMQAANEQNKTGGYQSDFAQDRDFMDGGDRDRGNNPGDKGGSNTMGSF
jgi:hypothetical protein